jgi:transposase
VVLLRFNYRVEPTPGQQVALARAFGCARVVFNDGLRARREAREAGLPYIGDGDLSQQVITRAKDTPERAWLGEVPAVVLQQALADLNVAYRNFFASINPDVRAGQHRADQEADRPAQIVDLARGEPRLMVDGHRNRHRNRH